MSEWEGLPGAETLKATPPPAPPQTGRALGAGGGGRSGKPPSHSDTVMCPPPFYFSRHGPRGLLMSETYPKPSSLSKQNSSERMRRLGFCLFLLIFSKRAFLLPHLSVWPEVPITVQLLYSAGGGGGLKALSGAGTKWRAGKSTAHEPWSSRGTRCPKPADDKSSPMATDAHGALAGRQPRMGSRRVSALKAFIPDALQEEPSGRRGGPRQGAGPRARRVRHLLLVHKVRGCQKLTQDKDKDSLMQYFFF